MTARPAVPAPPDDDPRFTAGLWIDVRTVLVKHGYPEDMTGLEIVDLQQALWRFLYVDSTVGHRAAKGCDGCREIGPHLVAPGTSGRDWRCESCGTVWSQNAKMPPA